MLLCRCCRFYFIEAKWQSDKIISVLSGEKNYFWYFCPLNDLTHRVVSLGGINYPKACFLGVIIA